MTTTTVESSGETVERTSCLTLFDCVVLAVTIVLWLATFLIGTLVNSAPYRTAFSELRGTVLDVVANGAVVGVTYTLTNVCLLCLFASLLGSFGAAAKLGVDGEKCQGMDTTAPRISALLRGFLVYLALIAGVLMFGDGATAPTQSQYVKLAGAVSLLGFVVNYHPALFAGLLTRMSKLFEK
jgi:hypothetical protein